MISPKAIYEKLSKGDHLTLEELNYGHQHFTQMGRSLEASGPVFELAARESIRIADTIILFLQNRRMDDVNEDRNSESYRDGYRTGIVWDQVKDNYRPGGPHVYTSRNDSIPKYKLLAEQSEINHRRWMLGFDEGLAAQKAGARPTPDMLICNQEEVDGHKHWLTCLIKRGSP